MITAPVRLVVCDMAGTPSDDTPPRAELLDRLAQHFRPRLDLAYETHPHLDAGTNAAAGMVGGVPGGASNAPALGRAPDSHILASVADVPGRLGLPPDALAGS